MITIDNFFRWICRLICKNDFLGPEESTYISRMIKMKSMIFPERNFSRLRIRNRPGVSPFLVTLRHGSMGMVTILRYFGVDQFLETRQNNDRLACQSAQNEVHRLLPTIQINYHLESKQTRAYIKLFTVHLKSAYTLIHPDFHQTEKNS